MKKGFKQSEIFHFVSLFEENVAGDRLSDMIATLIEPEIKKYTLCVMREMGINKETYCLRKPFCILRYIVITDRFYL